MRNQTSYLLCRLKQTGIGDVHGRLGSDGGQRYGGGVSDAGRGEVRRGSGLLQTLPVTRGRLQSCQWY